MPSRGSGADAIVTLKAPGRPAGSFAVNYLQGRQRKAPQPGTRPTVRVRRTKAEEQS